ncbi:MAG: nuclear transport factor 2 family protein [Pseudomonadota bacterium]
MATTEQELVNLETRFWQSMVDQDADTALGLLAEPAVMVSSHGAMQFDHAGYRKMAEQGTMTVASFEFADMKVLLANPATAILTYRVKQRMQARGKSDVTTEEMNDSSTWVKSGSGWKCVMHTESPVPKKAAK